MKDYKRLTNNNRDEYNPEYDFCCDCKYFGEPCGCNRPNGTCGNYDRFIETYSRLAALENAIENGTLIELPCKVGNVVYEVFKDHKPPFGRATTIEKIIITNKGLRLKLSRNSVYETAISSLGETLFLTEAEAIAKLEELRK